MKKTLSLGGLLLAMTNLAAAPKTSSANCPATLQHKLPMLDGKEKNLCDYKGEVLLVVNVASRCGYTKQYSGLEALHQKYKDQGLRVLGFPSNQFGEQEPGTAQEIRDFCSTKFNVSFDLFAKSDVNGPKANSLYAQLTKASPFPGEIGWNFSKFLIGRDGTVLARYKSSVEPMDAEVTKAVEGALAKGK